MSDHKDKNVWLGLAAVLVLLVCSHLSLARSSENGVVIPDGKPVLSAEGEKVIKITAKQFEFSPREIKLKKGQPVVLELTTLDRSHGFNCPDLGVRADIEPGKVSRVRLVPQKTGSFDFTCDIFCGEGHMDMAGKIVVEE